MFSVIIPVYNKGDFIERCLSTVFNQSYKNFEVIVVDDGSTDDSLVKIQSFEDPRIKVIVQENKGVSEARNVAVNAASREFVAFLDADDYWESNYLAEISYLIDRFKNCSLFATGGAIINGKTFNSRERILPKYRNKLVELSAFENPHILLHTSALVMTKEIFSKCGGFDKYLQKNEDYLLFYKAALLSKLAYSGKVLSYYYIGAEFQITGLDRFQTKFTLSIARRIQELDRFYVEGALSDWKYLSWMKYEINHYILDFLRLRKYEQLQLFVDSIKSISYVHSFNLMLLDKCRTFYLGLIYMHKIKFKIEKKLL